MTTKPKVLILYDKNGVCFWRSYLPAKEMQKQGLADVRFVELRYATKESLAEDMKWSDIIHMAGLMDTNGLSMLRKYKELGCKVAVDYDDLHFNCSPFNPYYKNFGLEEVRVKDPKTGEIVTLWEDGKNGLDIKRNRIKFHSYRTVLQEADVITTPSYYLKEAMTEIGGSDINVAVLPNAVDFTQWKPLDIRDKFADRFRFGWAVSASHGEDWLFIKPALTQFLEKHKEAKFVCLGDTHMDITALALPKEQVEWYPFSNLWEGHYQLRMAMLGLDVGIAPLADLEFNRCKSPLKYAEYTALGWPVIAQNMTPYKEHIIHGDTGLLASSIEDWLACLESMYQNESLRRTLRFNALQSCKEMFDITKVAKEWADVFNTTISGVSINAK